MSRAPAASVVVTTYNNPRYLELVLLGYARQDRRDFEVVVADDGSRPDTKALLDRMRPTFPVPLVHAWQDDIGFRQARVMNWGALHARADLLVFTDGDCVPPADFVSRHVAAAGPRRLVVGGCVRLTEAQSATVTPDEVTSGRFARFVTTGVRASMWLWHLKNLWYLAIGDRRRPKIQGLNFSIDRAAFEAVNGFDLRYENNARQDSDLRNRLRLGRGPARCIWHTCIVVHLWHPTHRGRHAWTEADAYYERTDLQPWAARGLRELAQETGRALRPATDARDTAGAAGAASG